MPEGTLQALLERNDRHVESLAGGYFDAVQEGQTPEVVSICCSDSRVSQEGMWAVEEPGWLFTPSTIGNQVCDRHDGAQVVDGSLLYPLAYTGTTTAAVVGHTGCGAVSAALDAVQHDETGYGDQKGGDGNSTPPGIAKWVDLLVPIVEDGLDDDRVDPDRDVELVDQLVEYNVDRQVRALRDSDEVPDDVSIYGFVYDFQNVYGDVRGRTYLVNADGQTDRGALERLLPDEYDDHVERLL